MGLLPANDQTRHRRAEVFLRPRIGIRCACVLLIFPLTYNAAFSQTNNPQSPLFASDEILEIRLSGDTRALLNDRKQDAPYYPVTLSFLDQGKGYKVPLKVRTRGHFRLDPANCTYPPLLLNFSKKKDLPNPFSGQDKIKLVTPCRADKYVIQEFQVYKLYNLITPKSLQARLTKVIFEDTVRAKTTQALYGILLEDDDQMASRNGSFVTEKKSVRPESTNRSDFLKMAVFEYLIGNTDWSVQYLQNIELIVSDSAAIPSTVAYDFDHAGIVRAPYAKPAPELMMGSTLMRRYRGFCVNDMSEFTEVFALFNQLKDSIYGVYTNNPLLEEKYVKSTVKFLDEFYGTINDPVKAKKEFMYPCDKDGTGNVVIKGLKQD